MARKHRPHAWAATAAAGSPTKAGAVLGAAIAHDREHRAEMLERWLVEKAQLP